MSQYVSTHALERSIRAMSTGALLSLDAKRTDLGYDALQEIEHQFQIPIWGIASSGVGWSTFDVPFDVQFFFAPEQRDSPLAVPHFSYGPVVSGVPSPDGASADPNNPDCLVAVFCQVVEWSHDEALDVTDGARVGVGVSTIGSAVDVRFDGYVHLTFQGYGNVIEDLTDSG
jgi:hypothetical protein